MCCELESNDLVLLSNDVLTPMVGISSRHTSVSGLIIRYISTSGAQDFSCENEISEERTGEKLSGRAFVMGFFCLDTREIGLVMVLSVLKNLEKWPVFRLFFMMAHPLLNSSDNRSKR
jgi:hypothetical protein